MADNILHMVGRTKPLFEEDIRNREQELSDIIKNSRLSPQDIKSQFVCNILYVGILISSISALAASTYNPFIYFRF